MGDSMTWKETKQAYLLTLIKHGDLSRGHLDSLIGEAQRMTSDRGILQAANVEDMRRVVEAYEDCGLYEKMLTELKDKQDNCRVWKMFKQVGTPCYCDNCKTCQVITEIEGGK